MSDHELTEKSEDNSIALESDNEFDEPEVLNETVFERSAYHVEGVPLSVELSESILRSSESAGSSSSQCFVKSADIFLRIDSDVDSVTETDSNSSNAKQLSTATSDASSSKQFFIDGGSELQYENEFFDPNDDESNFTEAPRINHRLSLESDNEQLLFEGISQQKPKKKKKLCLINFYKFRPNKSAWDNTSMK